VHPVPVELASTPQVRSHPYREAKRVLEDAFFVLAVSPQTVMRDWKLAKAWLMRELEKGA
jgi:hypothetical protein